MRAARRPHDFAHALRRATDGLPNEIQGAILANGYLKGAGLAMRAARPRPRGNAAVRYAVQVFLG